MSEVRDLDSNVIRDEITQLESEVLDFSHKVAEMQARLGALRTELSHRAQRLNALRQEIARRNRPAPEPRVSEHALLRYIERVMGVDIEAARAAILTPAVVKAIQAGATGVIVNGVKFVVNGATVVTTMDNASRFKRATRKGHAVEIEDLDEQVADYYEDRNAELPTQIEEVSA